MNYFWKFCSVVLLTFVSIQAGLAQTVFIDYTNDEGTKSICAWESAKFYRLPGEKTIQGTILFGEELIHKGQEALVKEDKINYILVENKEGKVGWVNETFLVKDAGLVVVLDRTRMYGTAGSYASAKDSYFQQGEMAILSDYKDDWLYLVGKMKKKRGWIKGYKMLSIDPQDIAIASMLRKARAKKTRGQQLDALREIGTTRGFMESSLAPIVKSEIRRINRGEEIKEDEGVVYLEEDEYLPDGEDGMDNTTIYYENGLSPDFNELEALNGLKNPNNILEESGNYRLEEQEVVDFSTNRTYIRYRETGKIAPVKAKNPPSIYYGYHKTLPKGSKVLLEVPGTDKYVELTIIAALRKDNPNMIGLGKELLQAVYGESQAKNVPSATIQYYPAGN
ncbi:MAG: hypothetical protein AAFY71_18965 [Bacteroidota bacterium]